MRELAKITLDGVRYIIWDELRGMSPKRNGMSLLLSDRDGVGADVLLVLPGERPLAVRAYGKDGAETALDAGARRAVAFALENLALPLPGSEDEMRESEQDRVEVRLTDSFCARLFRSEEQARIAV